MLNQCFNIIDFCLIYRSTDYYYFFQFLFRIFESQMCMYYEDTNIGVLHQIPKSLGIHTRSRHINYNMYACIHVVLLSASLLCISCCIFLLYAESIFPSVKQPQVYHFTTNKKALVGAFFYCTIAYKRDNFLPILSTILSCSATGGRGAEPSLTYPGLAD